MKSRRKFVFDCSAVMAALAVAPISAFSRTAGLVGGMQSLEQMSYPVLADQVNTTFRVRLSSGQVVELKLLKAPLAPSTPAVPGRRPPVDAGHERFSLIFSGPKDDLIEPAIHRFEHEQLGRFEMYVGQIGMSDATSVRYETVFNRPAPAASAFPKII